MLATSGILAGVLTIWQSPHDIARNSGLGQGATICFILAFVVVIVASILALRTRKYNIPPDPAKLDAYVLKPVEDTLGELLKTLQAAYQGNERKIQQKVKWFHVAFYALIAQLAVLAVSYALLSFA